MTKKSNLGEQALRVLWQQIGTINNKRQRAQSYRNVAAAYAIQRNKNGNPSKNCMKNAKNFVTKHNLEMVKTGGPDDIRIALKHGAKTSILKNLLQEKNIINHFHRLHESAFSVNSNNTNSTERQYVRKYAIILTKFLRSGAPIPDEEELAQLVVDSYIHTGIREIMTLIHAMTERGVHRGHFYWAFFFHSGYSSDRYQWMWRRGLRVLRSIIPLQKEAREEYFFDLLFQAIVYMTVEPRELKDLMALGARLTPELLHEYVMYSYYNDYRLDPKILAVFAQAGVRYPYDHEHTANTRNALQRAGLYEPLRASPPRSPARPGAARPPAKTAVRRSPARSSAGSPRRLSPARSVVYSTGTHMSPPRRMMTRSLKRRAPASPTRRSPSRSPARRRRLE